MDEHWDNKIRLRSMAYLVYSRALLVCFVTWTVFLFLKPRSVLLFPSQPGAGSEKVKLCKLMVKRRRDSGGEREKFKDRGGLVVSGLTRSLELL